MINIDSLTFFKTFIVLNSEAVSSFLYEAFDSANWAFNLHHIIPLKATIIAISQINATAIEVMALRFPFC